ncbi:prophage Lp2 protein 33 [Streptococcus pneumoniae]|uniref:hypothetical protein n=1 Tax=Streptococcus pneumoniae TaxID=1313 RepID=UPI0010D0AEBD|nr:hypothetical protein [Streptococcus pneumoniae]MDY6753380.1 hypothetical protein [Streptococcus pneumoniae]VKJ69626.1 prophage Lp2 protein 33 [Streptococcus pneumoniae]VMK38351.1 prophage Lp2 protein 33 [Streptococcus pneumoniae]VNS28796.1 prophage Lp2 protein 33 [Streptococcus pneumoniae]VPN59432.1 prophage Lp2 protein 33 [Streptococcus pneumoniae]
MKYRKKPVVVEAVKWTGENVKEIATFMGIESVPYDLNTRKLSIVTLEGIMEASQGDYIIKGVQGEIYPCKQNIFAETYEELEYLNILDTI